MAGDTGTHMGPMVVLDCLSPVIGLQLVHVDHGLDQSASPKKVDHHCGLDNRPDILL